MTSVNSLTIMSYNIQMTPSIFNLYYNWWNRIPHFVDYITEIVNEKNPDVIIFQEAFYTKAIKCIRDLSETLPVFRYQTPILTSRVFNSDCIKKDRASQGLLVNIRPSETGYTHLPYHLIGWDSISGAVSSIKLLTSGVIIVSKYPIQQCHGFIYSHGAFPDKFGSKGAVFIQIEKDEKLFNIIGTHLQSGSSNNKVRLEQIADMNEWLKGDKYPEGPSKLLHEDIPLIFGGDFNLRFNEDMPALQMALSPQMLDARTILPRSVFDMDTTYDTELNQLCNIEEGYPNPSIKIIFDYLLLSNKYGGSVAKLQESVSTKVKKNIIYRFFKFGIFPYKSTYIHDLSDHFPIVGSFYWEKSIKSVQKS